MSLFTASPTFLQCHIIIFIFTVLRLSLIQILMKNKIGKYNFLVQQDSPLTIKTRSKRHMVYNNKKHSLHKYSGMEHSKMLKL